jgi:hypothetical protein
MRNGLFDHRHRHEIFLSRLDRFANRFRDFAGFADCKPDFALPIADYDERAEAEAFTAFDDLRDAIYTHDGLFESGIVAFAATTTTVLH